MDFKPNNICSIVVFVIEYTKPREYHENIAIGQANEKFGPIYHPNWLNGHFA